MYAWVVPPEILGRLWEIRERTKVPIARQIREAVQAYLSEAEAKAEVSHEVRQDEVLVLGKLTAEGVAKMQFGGSQVTREKNSGMPVSLGDDLKAASTDSLKKCASLLGVGLHLYAEKPMRQGAPGRATPERREARSAPANGQVTPRQLDAIAKVARAKGLDAGAVESMSLKVFNRKPEALSQVEAARLIRELSNLKRNAA